MSKSGTGVSSSGGIFLNEARRFENRTRRSEFLLSFSFFLSRFFFFVFALRMGSGFVFGMLREVDDGRGRESRVCFLRSRPAHVRIPSSSAWSVEFPISCTFIGCHYRRASIQISRSKRESFGPIS